ncbi:MAG: aminoglycoside phosphotransferase family protein [Thermoanaerobaculia bacterium]
MGTRVGDPLVDLACSVAMNDVTLGDRAVGLATAAARDSGLNPAGAAIHRHIVSVHVELPAAGVMARVEARDRLAIAQRQVRVARLLESRKLPAARLVFPDRQPLIYSDGVVTLWGAVVILERRPDAAVLGRLARRLHEATTGILPAEIPDIDPLSLVRGWLPRLDTEPIGEEVGKLWDELEWLERSWGETIAGDPLGTVLVHGDFHQDNVVVTPEGPTLLDLEEAGRGPASWDLVPHLVGVRRYGKSEDICRFFLKAYGADPLKWEGTEILCRAYELLLIVWAIAHRHTSPAMAAEGELRLSSFLGSTDEPWNLL